MERNLDFDMVIDRRNTKCLKYDFAKKRGMPEDILPMWVADMDFKTSSYVEDAIVEWAGHGIFGYSETDTPYFEAVREWMRVYHEWEPQEKWLVKTPGVVFALAMAIRAYTEPGDAVLIQQPVYYPFSEVIRDNGRKVVSNDLYLGEDNRYHIDFEDFEKKMKEEKIRLFLLCSPHNPVGRAWTVEELTRMGELCVRYGVTVVSDEIHHDFIFRENHHVFASLKKEFEEISIICTSPSKTFNLAGMMLSNIFIPNQALRRKFRRELDAAGISQLGIMGLVACEAAYSKGGEWYRAMMSYVKDNIVFTRQYVKEHLHGVVSVEQEATYLVWLDFRGLGLETEELDQRMIHQAKLWLDSGRIFGECGRGFQRINVACPRSVLEQALQKLEKICIDR